MSNESLWQSILKELEPGVSASFYKAFLSRTKLLRFDDHLLEVECASDQAKDQIEKRYLKDIRAQAAKIVGFEVSVVLIVSQPLLSKPTKPAPLLDEIAKTQSSEQTYYSNLSPRYTFDNFVVGSNNRLAVAVARAITDNPGTVYNPFFLYSGVGLGKTHLMQAVGNEILKNKKGSKVFYITGESFTNELVEAIQNSKRQYNAVAKFRDKYRNVDALLIDDIQFIAGRETTQEEFFHTFNALYLNRKQIIMTSDRPPKDISKLEERLSSRFLSGMTADMQAPDLDMRVAILRKKRDALGLPLANEIVDFVAERVVSNIRELEGTLLQVAARAQTADTPIGISQAAETLGQAQAERAKGYSIPEIIKAVATYYSVRTTDLKGPRRQKEIVWPRQIAMYLIYNLTKTPLQTIGQLFGGRDHSTVIHSNDKITAELKSNTKLNQDIINIKQGL